ncbi:hypothetical protein Q1695_001878 [Nippostrongylus brasiliensis]|nr:hypothetical protein Q1695_001878 [Nippostrongylus brasiliensis]
MEPFIEISSTQGLTARFLPLGATLTSLFVKDREGNLVDVVLGFDNIEGYKADTAYLGRTVGRVCNRVHRGKFSFEGKDFEFPVSNGGPHLLHGGPHGIAMREWEVVRHTPTSVTFRVWADEANDGFPGDAKIDVTYTVNDRNELLIEHGAICWSPGVLNLTNHTYWNLDGSASIRDHLLWIDANSFLPTDEDDFPTGETVSVKNGVFDFSTEKPISTLEDPDGHIRIDNDFILRPDRHGAARVLSLYSPRSGIKMEVTTSYPVIHLYGARHLQCQGKGGEEYGPGKGLAVEAQFHTGSLHYENFPDISLSPDAPYIQEVVHSFSVIPSSS